ncbi:MAG TPA: EAL domain-containing protein [Treponemataceae bacterium]|nr:EAL domain-containing protein [Treponemataceae bacterium]
MKNIEAEKKNQLCAHELLKAALANSDILCWEWDILSGECFFCMNSVLQLFNKNKFDNFPQSFIDAGYVKKGSITPFKKMHEKVQTSSVYIEDDILLSVGEKEKWYRITYTPSASLENKNNFTIAIAIAKPITREKEAQIQYYQSMKFQFVAKDDILGFFEYNLTQNNLITFNNNAKNNSKNDSVSQNVDTGSFLDWLLQLMLEKAAYQEDKIKMKEAFSKENLIGFFNEKNYTIKLDYRRKTDEGSIIWVEASCWVVKNPKSHDKILYGVLKNIDKQKKIELSLRSKAEHDVITGFYNQETLAAVVDEMIKKNIEPHTNCAVLIFDIDNYLTLMNMIEYKKCKKVLKEIGQLIDTKFSGAKIAGRIEGDEFFVFLYDNPNKEKVIKIAEDIRIAISMPFLFPDFSLTISCGIVFSLIEGQTYKTLHEKAEFALENAKKNGKNQVVVYEEKLSKDVKETQENKTKKLDSKNASEEAIWDQKEILLKIAFSLSEIETFESAMVEVLRSIANYYDAREAFLIELDERCKSVENQYIWYGDTRDAKKTKQGLAEIKDIVLRTWISALKSNRCFIVADIDILKGGYTTEYETLHRHKIDSFFLVAITRHDIVCGYMGINNPRKAMKDRHFLQVVAYYLSNVLAKQRIIKRQEYLVHHDLLTGFFTREVYENDQRRFAPDSLISVGLVYCQVRDLQETNHKYGYVYGDSLLLFVSGMIKQLFTNDTKYRYSGDGFVIVVENTLSDVFYSKVAELKMECAKSFKNLIAVGYSWKDYEISINELFLHASERLYHDRRILAKSAVHVQDSHYEKALEKVQKDIKEGRYVVFLQPKVRCSDGAICGAEALVRYYDDDGNIIEPNSFIPYLEAEGLIPEIDFFMLEAVNAILESWLDKGGVPYPVSLNFSRVTMMYSDIFERVESIQKKFSISRAFLEIEMTETIGSIEEDVLIQIGKKLFGMGFSLALDDFGARYSNLSILTFLPFNVLKLDKTLIRDIFFNARTKIVVQSFLTTCTNLNIYSIAEGVENQEQFDILKEMGCDAVQGYLINKPIPVEMYEKKYLNM